MVSLEEGSYIIIEITKLSYEHYSPKYTTKDEEFTVSVYEKEYIYYVFIKLFFTMKVILQQITNILIYNGSLAITLVHPVDLYLCVFCVCSLCVSLSSPSCCPIASYRDTSTSLLTLPNYNTTPLC